MLASSPATKSLTEGGNWRLRVSHRTAAIPESAGLCLECPFMDITKDASVDISNGDRFAFGQNWGRYLALLDEQRIREAERSLQAMLGLNTLQGKTFLDIGSGSGLFSLAARRLGARVHSFDFDSDSVACTRRLKAMFFPDDPNWHVEPGSVLDKAYMQAIGQHDIVYSWGVLHHTGQQWGALANAADRVAERGLLFIALYNDQGRASSAWVTIKKTYCASPKLVKQLILAICTVWLWGPATVRDLLKGRPGYTWREYGKSGGRGMSPWRDVVDWVGGYPFEVSRPEQVFDFVRARGFHLEKLQTCGGGLGCNQFVFTKI